MFETTDTGPGTFARYLWSAFRDDQDLEFHLVAPKVAEAHPRLHAADASAGSLSLYRAVQDKGLQVARSMSSVAIAHGNSTHGMSRFADYPGPLIVQVNDYEGAVLWNRIAQYARTARFRRLASASWRHMQERRVLGHASLALCNSEYTAQAIKRVYRIPETRVRVIHKAVHTAAFRRPALLPVDPVPGRTEGGRLIFVGSDWLRKGLDILLHATVRVVRCESSMSLLVIGPSSEDVALHRLVQELGLSNHVHIVGPSPPDQVAKYLWHSDLFVLPSRREALGVAIVEAMAAGLPIVSTRVGGIPEIVRSDDEGILVAPENSEALANALLRLLKDPELRSGIGNRAERRAQDFSVEAMIQQIKHMYLSFNTSTLP